MRKFSSFLILISLQFLFARSAHAYAEADAVNCSRPVGPCTSPAFTVTEIDVGVQVTGYGRESDTEKLPLAIAAMPSGRSRLAWLGTNDSIYIAELDCDDHLVVGSIFSIPAVDLQDIYADESGGVVLLTRKATNGGQDNCGNGQLCRGESSQCYAMWLVRFEASGTVTWETQVTNLSETMEGYDNGARFVWWYQHHGRIAFDGSTYATYFCIGITVNNGSCVDIHEGDRMQVVSSSGSLVRHGDAFEVGASHSWTTRLVWDPRTNHFVMVCATDNNCRIARPSPYRTIASAECNGTLFNGDVVLAAGRDGYWVAWSLDNEIRLEHFTTGASDTTIRDAGNSQHPHLVSYGAENMLLAWGSGSGMTAQVHSANDGSPVGSPFTIAVPDHDFQALKACPDGSVAYAGSGSSRTSIRIARVMPCGTTGINTKNSSRIKGGGVTFSPDNRHCTMHLDRGQSVAMEVFFLDGKKSERLSTQRFYAAGVHTIALPDSRQVRGVVVVRVAGDGFSEIAKVHLLGE
ncbi:MAG: hypothetical protein JW768_01295 [Chitinispirillaceae bacterium]|nr:hypothetical protein [Chitinispirillaceae bacterium]